MRYLKRKKQAVIKWPVTIIQDDREKKPWEFNPDNFKVKKRRLAVGDYSIEGYEHLIAIEKKNSLKELVTNLSGRYRPTFKKFLAKLERVPFKIIVVEDNLSNVEKTIRRMRTGLTSYSVYYWISKILITHRIPVVFVGKGRIKRDMVHELFVQIVTAAHNGDFEDVK